MKKIGLLGGMSWESTLEYYRVINEKVREKRGGDSSAEILLYSFDFKDVIKLQKEGGWDELSDRLVEAGKFLKNGGADLFLMCANTVHKRAGDIEDRVGLPLLHIGDTTGDAIQEQGLEKVGLVGTDYVMSGDFYSQRLKEKYGIDVLIPREERRKKVHSIIYDELCRGIVKEESKSELVEMMEELLDRGAGGIILGCTELPLHITREDIDVPLFDTTRLHAEGAAEAAVG